MSLYIVSRRKVVFVQPSAGGALVVYVPSADQIQVMKDAAGTNTRSKPTPGHRHVVREQQLARVQKGQRILYGSLPNEILELPQSVKVWLPEDLAPLEAEAFFYVLSPQVVIHGIRERNDEGRLVWRTAQLQLPAADAAMPALQLILADYSLANPGQNVCLAVANDAALFRQVQQGHQISGFEPIPFSTLKPTTDFQPLYSHQNFNWLYILLLLIGLGGILAIAVLWMAEAGKSTQLQQQIEEIESQIRAVQINKRTGYIRQPNAVLNELTAGIAVSPSALIQAAAELGQNLGELQQVSLERGNKLDTEADVLDDPNLQQMKVVLKNSTQSLLVDQANTMMTLLPQMPWVRQVIRQGQQGDALLELAVMLQVTGTVPPLGHLTSTSTALVDQVQNPSSSALKVSATVAVRNAPMPSTEVHP
jgi:hypothetical protein